MLAYSAIFKEEHETYGIRNDHDFLLQTVINVSDCRQLKKCILINSSSLFGVYLVHIFSVGFPGEVWPHLYLCRSSSRPPVYVQQM